LRRAEGGAKNFGVFLVKNHYFMQTNLILNKTILVFLKRMQISVDLRQLLCEQVVCLITKKKEHTDHFSFFVCLFVFFCKCSFIYTWALMYGLLHITTDNYLKSINRFFQRTANTRCSLKHLNFKYRAGTYFDAGTEMHSGFIYEPQNLWPQRFEVSSRWRQCSLLLTLLIEKMLPFETTVFDECPKL
jgi:hypothetical protein